MNLRKIYRCSKTSKASILNDQMPRRETEKENSADENGEEVGVPPAAIDENTGKENDPLEENGDELSSSESEFVNGESDREKKKNLSQTKNPQQRVTRTKTKKTASRLASPQTSVGVRLSRIHFYVSTRRNWIT